MSMPVALSESQLFSHTLLGELHSRHSRARKHSSFALATRSKRKRLCRAFKSRGRNSRFRVRDPTSQVDTNGWEEFRKREREGKREKQNWSALYSFRAEGTNKTRLSVVSEYRGWKWFARSCHGCPRTRGRATSRSSTFLSRETRKRIGKVHAAFVTRGTAAITCQLWGTVCPVCLSLERESTEGGSCPDVGAEGEGGSAVLSRWDSWYQWGPTTGYALPRGWQTNAAQWAALPTEPPTERVVAEDCISCVSQLLICVWYRRYRRR